MARIKVSKNFKKAVAGLDHSLQERALEAVTAFQEKPSLPGLRLEKLRGFKNKWSIRIDGGNRILLSREKDEHGQFWNLLDVGPHDIYRRAGR